MIKIREAVIVEGKYDKIRLSSLLDTVIITTDGFGIFKDKEKMDMIRLLAEKRGILILTDSDSAGFLIRNYLTGCVDKKYIKQAYIPQISGREKRKTENSKEGLLGVEGMETEALTAALERAGVCVENGNDRSLTNQQAITKLDFFKDGLSGGSMSAQKRKALLKKLDLPDYLSQNAMLDILNTIMTYEEYKQLINEMENEENEK